MNYEEGAALPIDNALGLEAASVIAPPEETTVDLRLATICAVAIVVGIGGGVIAKILISLINLITNISFFQRFDASPSTPIDNHVGAWVLVIPVLGAVIVGVMARYGSKAIRGHGIPEVMEKVLYGESRIPLKLMFLKPLSAAVAIGTGGPFGAEGPIIATGGALGSSIGQLLHITNDERKTLLAAGAAAGMAATFGTPVSAVLLSIELLLFEYRARSIIPVALASCAATSVRLLIITSAPAFRMGNIVEPTWQALVFYTFLGTAIGVAAVGITRAVYWIEDKFEELPVHWMWWPAVGAVAVGIIGFFDARVLGVGYQNIDAVLTGKILGVSLILLITLKFLAWSIYLGSGTSGGTLAPLFTLGGGLGALLGGAVASAAPALGISIPVAALVGMAAIFAGASHALLAAIVFAFEATRQPLGLLPLLAGCSTAYLVSITLMRTSIMTEKLARRGVVIRPDYAMDFMGQHPVREVMSADVVTLKADKSLAEVRTWFAARSADSAHQGYPVVTNENLLLGVLTRRDMLDPEHPAPEKTLLRDLVSRPPAVVYPENTLREAADHMVRSRVGRLAVVDRASGKIMGIVSRSDLLSVHERRLDAATLGERPT
jgi:H+/Cl- antiporter ClcA/predicted transcriptional regulator